jgi:hypothetical protein
MIGDILNNRKLFFGGRDQRAKNPKKEMQTNQRRFEWYKVYKVY